MPENVKSQKLKKTEPTRCDTDPEHAHHLQHSCISNTCSTDTLLHIKNNSPDEGSSFDIGQPFLNVDFSVNISNSNTGSVHTCPISTSRDPFC